MCLLYLCYLCKMSIIMILYMFFHFVHALIRISGIRAICSLIVSRCMSPTRSEYREFGLELVSLDHYRRPKWPPMAEEKRDDGAGDPIKSLLEEALERQRNEMKDSFVQILQWMPAAASASSTSSRFGDANPFKVQVNFDIPLFEGNIDADTLDNWLNVLEGYFYVHKFSNK